MGARLTYSPDNRWVIECFEMEAYDPSDGTKSFLDSDATVQVTPRLKSTGVAIAGEVFPKATTYRSGSDGVFYAFLSKDLVVNPRARYVVWVDGDDGDGSDFGWEEPLEVIDPRRGGD